MREESNSKVEKLQKSDASSNHAAHTGQTRYKKKNKQLEELEGKFRSLFDNMNEGILFTDVKKKQFVTGNNAICQMLGYNPAEITNLQVADIHPKENSNSVVDVGQFDEHTRDEVTLSRDILLKRKNGSVLCANVSSVPVTSDGRKYLMSVFREVHSQKIESIQQQDTSKSSPADNPLTPSETKIFELLANGMSNKEIAYFLHRSVRTIEWHHAHIMRKLGVNNLADLVKQAAVMGLIDLSIKQKKNETT